MYFLVGVGARVVVGYGKRNSDDFGSIFTTIKVLYNSFVDQTRDSKPCTLYNWSCRCELLGLS